MSNLKRILSAKKKKNSNKSRKRVKGGMPTEETSLSTLASAPPQEASALPPPPPSLSTAESALQGQPPSQVAVQQTQSGETLLDFLKKCAEGANELTEEKFTTEATNEENKKYIFEHLLGYRMGEDYNNLSISEPQAGQLFNFLLVLFDTNGDKKLSMNELDGAENNNDGVQKRVDSIRRNIYHDKDVVYEAHKHHPLNKTLNDFLVFESNLLEESDLITTNNNNEYISAYFEFNEDYKSKTNVMSPQIAETDGSVLSKVKYHLKIFHLYPFLLTPKIEQDNSKLTLVDVDLSKLIEQLQRMSTNPENRENFYDQYYNNKKSQLNFEGDYTEDVLKKLIEKANKQYSRLVNKAMMLEVFRKKINTLIEQITDIQKQIRPLEPVKGQPALDFKIDQITNSTHGCSYNNKKLEFSFRNLEEPSESGSDSPVSKLIIPGYFLQENFEPSQKAYLILKYFESRALAIRDELEKDQSEFNLEQKVKSALKLREDSEFEFSSYFYKTEGEDKELKLMDHSEISKKVEKSLNDLSGHVIAGSCRTRRAYNLASKSKSSFFSSPIQRDAGQARLRQKYDDDLALTLKSTVRFITAKVGNILINPYSVLEDQLFFQRILERYNDPGKSCLCETEFCTQGNLGETRSLESAVSTQENLGSGEEVSDEEGSGDDGSGKEDSEAKGIELKKVNPNPTPVTPVPKLAEEQYQLFTKHIKFLYSLYSSDLLSRDVTEKPINFLKNFLIPYLLVNVGFKDNLWSDITEGTKLTSRSFSLEQKAFMLDWDLTEEQKKDAAIVEKRGKMLGKGDPIYIRNMSFLKNLLTGDPYQGSETRLIDDRLYGKPEIKPINDHVGRKAQAICVQNTVGGFKYSKKRLPRKSQLIYSKKKQIPSKSLKKKKLLKKISKKHKLP